MSARKSILALTAALGVGPFLSGTVAQGFAGHAFAPPSFGSFAMAVDVAVDQSNGNVYVADSGANVVKVFGASGGTPAGGAPAELTGAETPAGSFNFNETFREPAAVAVDDSGGVSNGDVYVADLRNHVVDKFALNASHEFEYVCQLTGVKGGCDKNEPTVESTPETAFGEPTGVAVDAAGNVYVADYNNAEIDEFASTGTDVRQIKSSLMKSPSGLAIDSSNNLYTYNWSTQEVVKLTRGVSGDVESEAIVDSGPATALAVDKATGRLYVDHGSFVAERTLSGSLLSEFGEGTLLQSAGVAVNEATGGVYASDRQGATYLFAAVTLPDLLVGPVEEIGATSATIAGTIDPDAIDASSTVDYGTTAAYGSSVATVQAAGAPNPGSSDDGSGNTPVPVRAVLSGLIPNTTYHYRLAGTNANGTLHSQDHTFATLLAPPSVGEPSQAAANFAPLAGSVLLRANVNPENSPTTYHFVYGPTSAYGSRIPASEASAGSGFEVLPVSQVLEGLTPGATYHFALVAVNAGGTTTGPDVTFTARPPAVITGAASGVTYTTAILSGSVSPEGLKSTYQFETGTDTSYGSITGATDAGAGLAAQPVVASLENLQPGTTYHYRILATSQNGTSYGTDQTFTTPGVPSSLAIPPAAPLLATTPAIAFPAETGATGKPPAKRKPKAKKKVKHRSKTRGGKPRKKPKKK